MTEPQQGAQAQIDAGLVEALAAAYATLIKRQRTASAAFVRWISAHRRASEFCWISPGPETLLSAGKAMRIAADDPSHDVIRKMMATIELNPYERELLYGYPYVVGHVAGVPIRAPLLTIPIQIHVDGSALSVQPNEEMVRFNSLPFRTPVDSAVHEQALERLIDATPHFPLVAAELRQFAESVMREMKIAIRARLDGQIAPAPTQPAAESTLAIIDNAACFVAPKTSYFLASDLELISKTGATSAPGTALGWLIGRRGAEPTSNVFEDSRRVHFPFPSNASQRRVALLAGEAANRIIVVQGPPGTGKSLTIANVACHLVAAGKRVLISSQKDKALDVVDDMLRSLDLPQLPMTLLRQDSDSRRELRDRLDSIQKTSSIEETRGQRSRADAAFSHLVEDVAARERQLAQALPLEHFVAVAERGLRDASGLLRRMGARWGLWRALSRAERRAPVRSDALGGQAAKLRSGLLKAAVESLKAAADCRVGEASKAERNQLREFSKLLARNQTATRNFSIFDRLKREPEKCQALLNILPCWIMNPDDVARLFPCEPGLFDVVIIDEASQCDLPSMAPVLFRAKQAIIAGDSKQMQAQRFAFTNTQVAAQAWREHGLDRFDPDGWLDPARIDLLHLASHRLDEEAFLDEHYRSLPPIIDFSNQRWYGGRLRIMRDREDRRVGDGEGPVVALHRVAAGRVHPGTQENEGEAAALVQALREKLEDPGYAHASFGVICLFEEQMQLVNELVTERIDAELRSAHDLVVVNPDGFQGDERDVVFYSLSYDADGMEQAALSARQADREHIQGMLNVAFTRGREEIHIFHSAEIKDFGMASGRGTLLDWLRHCEAECVEGPAAGAPAQKAQSEFEAEVIAALSARGVKVTSQYPSCGFSIDIVAELKSERVAIECDGEIWNLDPHGKLRMEDVQRQEILERAGWTVLRIPYRSWRKDPAGQINRIVAELSRTDDASEPVEQPEPAAAAAGPGASLNLSRYEAAIFRAVQNGEPGLEEVLKSARIQLGLARLGPRVRTDLEAAIQFMQARGILSNEDHEVFLTEKYKNAAVTTYRAGRARGRRRRSP
ncbi:MAG TPA: AAA domain-containing protein [Bryobacteraceae bacterium]|nr:AAA domain-containing protein [Bryobacteraceae bacterium]